MVIFLKHQIIDPWPRSQITKQIAESLGKNGLEMREPELCLPVTLLADFLLGQLLVSPLVTMVWRSVWITGDLLVDR